MRRVNEAVKEVLSTAVSRELKDPRVGFVTLTGVEVSSDLSHAKVFVSVFGHRSQKTATLKVLEAAHGFLQARLAAELHMRRTPELQFVYDESVDEGMKIHMMLRAQERELGIDLSQPPAEEKGAEDGEEAGDEERGLPEGSA
ncbi:MAG: 30S ribosome-binding factor RbfA [Gaiellales bacterium]|nr:30S ribosome-binding factor RbfA [Gaiellales bacterium]